MGKNILQHQHALKLNRVSHRALFCDFYFSSSLYLKRNIIIVLLYLTALQINTFALAYTPTPPPLEFTVDHPFIAFIMENLNKLPLTVCRVTDPTVV
jgi:hypothetical protein